jgi:hypothetical protein
MFQQSVVPPASPAELYAIYLNANIHAPITGEPTRIGRKEIPYDKDLPCFELIVHDRRQTDDQGVRHHPTACPRGLATGSRRSTGGVEAEFLPQAKIRACNFDYREKSS